jgi:PKD repeat protein
LIKKISFIFFLSFFFVNYSTSQINANAGLDELICIGNSVGLGGSPAASGGIGPYVYEWTPSAGLSCTDCPNPTAAPTATSTYTLTVTDSTLSGSTDEVVVTVSPKPIASFTASASGLCANLPVQFTNTSQGSNNTYSWNFGNVASGSANSSSATNPSHKFISVGSTVANFTVSLTVTSQQGCVSLPVTLPVSVNQTPVAVLVDPIENMKNCNGTVFNMLVFDSSTPASASNYQIVWGDGSANYNSTSPPGGLSHTYSTQDIFDLQYLVTGINGCIDTAFYIVTNITNPAIGAANPGGTNGCGPLTICFPLTNFIPNHSSTRYLVDFGDGSAILNLPHPPPNTICHTYTTTSCGYPGNSFTFKIKAINLCDSSEATITPIRVSTPPVAEFTINPNPACVGSIVSFQNQTISGMTVGSCSNFTQYQWDFGDGTALVTGSNLSNPSRTHVYTNPGTYTVTLTASNSTCGISTSVKTVCIEAPPIPNFSLNQESACVSFTAIATDLSTLLNTCNVTYNWTVLFNNSVCTPSIGTWVFANGTNSTSVNPQFTFNSIGSYTISLNLTNSCGTFTFSKVVTIKGPPQVSIANLAAICTGSSVVPVANVNSCYEPISSYAWTFSNGSPATSATLIPGSINYPIAGTHAVNLTVTNACGTTSDTKNIIVKPLPSVVNPISNSPICAGATLSITLTHAVGNSYLWSGPNGFSSTSATITRLNVTTAFSGTYSVVVTNNGCSGPSESVYVVVNPLPIVSAGSNFSICKNASPLTLTGSPAGGTWTGNGVTAGSLNPSALAIGNHTLTYSYTDPTTQCSKSATVIATVLLPPTVNAGPDLNLCNQPIPTNLSGAPANGIWSGNGITNSSGVFTPPGVGSFVITYTVTASNGCSNSDQKTITVADPVLANAGADISVCQNSGSVTLSGSPVNGTWSGSGVSSSGVFSSTVVGTFNLIYTFGIGTCLTKDTLVAIVKPMPVVSAGSNFSICKNASPLTLIGSPSGGTWTGNGVLAGSLNPSALAIGNHTLTYSYTDPTTQCSNSSSVIATILLPPTVNAGPDLNLCNQPIPINLSGTPANGVWSGTGITNPSGVFTPPGVGSFVVTYTFTANNGCSNADQATITVADPVLANAGADISVCQNSGSVTLSGSPVNGTWSGSGVSSSGVFSSTVVGTFNLIYTFGSGTCLSKDTLVAIVKPLPVVSAGSNFSICKNASPLTLNGSPSGGTWTGNGVLAGVFNPSTLATGNQTLTYSYTDPTTLCSNSSTVIATVLLPPTVNAGPDLNLCNQPIPATLSATPAGGTWSGTGITNPSGVFTPSGIGSFIVTYTFTATNGCSNTDQATITVANPSLADAGLDTAVCIDAPNVQLTGLPTGGTWSGNGVNSSGVFDPTVSGNFTLTYSIGSGTCLTSDVAVITVKPLPVVSAGSAFSICENASTYTLIGSPAGGTWTGAGVAGVSFDPSALAVGNHTLTYSYTDSTTQCSNSSTVIATVLLPPTVNAGLDLNLCNQPIPETLTATPTGGTWSGTGITNPSGVFTPSAVGSFIVTYTFTAINGCTNTDQATITVIEPVLANAGADIAACHNSAAVNLAGLPINGTWGGTGVTSAGVFSPSTVGNFNLVYTIGAGTCLTRDTMQFTVNPLPIVNIGVNQEFCLSENPLDLIPNITGGIWTGTGITNASQGTFDPGTAGLGSHQIIYTYQNPITSCVNKDTLSILINPLPDVHFTNNAIACIGVSETFTNTSTLGQSFAWNFGDGSNSNLENPSHTFATVGFFDVQLIVTTLKNCRDSLVKQIELRELPVSDFSLTPDSSCAPVLVDFTNSSSGIGLTYAWSFGNGQVSTSLIPPTQTYLQGFLADTTYYISLVVTNFCGTSTHNDSVIAMPKPTSIFGSNLNTGCSPFTVEFANNSLGLPDSYYWDFGDGTTSTNPGALINHVFTTGTQDTVYTIMLVVANECGSDTSYHQITVLPNQVNAFFNTNITSGCEDLTVNFTQFSTGTNNTNWDFGDGNTTTIYSPTHTYTNPGNYQVNLYINDGCSFDTATVAITVFPSPIVNFSSLPDSACVNELFQFTNSSQNLSSTSWSFGDGGSSSLSNPLHAYAASGIYPVTLTGTSNTNGCTASITKNVIVSIQPDATFIANPLAGCVSLPVNFSQVGANVSFQSWNFGNGNVFALVNPQHTFNQAGTYTVSHYVENLNGCKDSSFQIITVYPLPNAIFSLTSTDPCFAPVMVNTNNLSTGANNYQWNLGNGITSNLTNETVVYTTPGIYNLTLTASNIYGCIDVFTMPFTVYPSPIAVFTASKQTICEGEAIVFSSQSSFADSLVWDMGDGTILTGNPITHVYGSPGNFPVVLTVYGAGGCTDISVLNPEIQVNPTPIADFTYDNIQNPNPVSGTVEFTNQSQNSSSYLWQFGNGNSSTDVNPVERYNKYGTFEVTLIASNQFGCRDTVRKVVQVEFFSGLFVPNALNPGHPNFGVSHFLPKGVGLRTYELTIYDTWGNVIWITNSLDLEGRPNEAWDGKFNEEIVKEDAYVWKVNATFLDASVWKGKEYSRGRIKRSGTVTVIR